LEDPEPKEEDVGGTGDFERALEALGEREALLGDRLRRRLPLFNGDQRRGGDRCALKGGDLLRGGGDLRLMGAMKRLGPPASGPMGRAVILSRKSRGIRSPTPRSVSGTM